MTKNILLAFIIIVFTTSCINAQVLHAQWKVSSKKVSACEYDLIFTVTIDKDWHIPSILKIKGAEDETFPTEIIFKPNQAYTLVGNLKETKPAAEYDKTVKTTVYYHYNKVVFTQRVKINANSKLKIEGTYEHQICDNVKCDFPPKDSFSIDLTGTAACAR
ncbi:MAG: hypothetical protein V4580_06605 [Bacteroidota bacterium]